MTAYGANERSWDEPPRPGAHARPDTAAPDTDSTDTDSTATAPGALRVAALASLAAGSIHATAVGSHGELRTVSIVFAVTAAVQIAWGALALVRSSWWVSLAGVAVNGAALGGWIMAKTTGISFISGMETAESPEVADTLCAVLAAVAVLGALVTLARWSDWAMRPRPVLVGVAGIAALALVVPGMVATGGHSHAGGHGGDGHDMAGMDHSGPPVPPKPYDGTLPVDLAGVPGVTAAEQAEAEDLVTRSIEELPQFADPAVAEQRGWHGIGDELTGFAHKINWPLIDDDTILDPNQPESLVYQVMPGGEQKLVAAMFILPRNVTIEDAPDFGGGLVQFHAHQNLCYGGQPNYLRIRAVVEPPGECPPGTFRDHVSPMVHVWIVPQACGPFAALEGEGGGVIPAGQERLCDHIHGTA